VRRTYSARKTTSKSIDIVHTKYNFSQHTFLIYSGRTSTKKIEKGPHLVEHVLFCQKLDYRRTAFYKLFSADLIGYNPSDSNEGIKGLKGVLYCIELNY